MRPESFRRIVNHGIRKYLKTGDIIPLMRCLPAMRKMYVKWSEEENDRRSGEETYGYEKITYHMNYFSDRWQCAFRLRWLIDGLDNGKFLEAGVNAT